MTVERPVKWMHVARVIHAARERAQMTQQQLADSIGVSVGYIGQLETGRRLGTVTTLRRIARATRTPESELLNVAGYAIEEPEQGIPAPVLAWVRRMVAKGVTMRQLESFENLAARFLLTNNRQGDDGAEDGAEDEGAEDGAERPPEH